MIAFDQAQRTEATLGPTLDSSARQGPGSMLLTRAWPRSSAVDDFDRWEIERHFSDLIVGPGIRRASYYHGVTTGLPSAWVGFGIRLALYTAPSLDELRAWISSAELATAVADGSGWFERMNELDFSSFTGNVYSLAAAVPPTAGLPSTTGSLLVERFEVLASEVAEFDEWLEAEYLPQVREAPNVASVRALHACREDIAVPYYLSPGNRAVIIAIASGAPVASVVRSPALLAALATSMRWDRSLEYVRREAYVYAAHLDAPERRYSSSNHEPSGSPV